ncbi:putative reverse transcriptase domain, viral movement protein [Tanacetum coccineum]
MNPDHYQLAKEECEQLVSQGIIEPTTPPWACEAFYVNKRSEQVRGKLRLHLADAKVLSNFDLKSGFWQLGIKPGDKLKMAFCIPDHHYQWKVMPFGFKKNAPSAFQKAMITICEPILANTLVYIDDILLLSLDEQTHAELLSKFYSLVTKYGIMLSEKKMEVGVTTIQFLGMEISDGKYQPQLHVAQELLKLPDELFSQKMIQQFLGLGSFLSPKAINDDGLVMYHAPYYFIHDWYKVNPPSRSKDHPDTYKWIKANGQWLYDNFDHCEVETLDDDDDARSLWSSDDDEHFDPFEDDPTHADARWRSLQDMYGYCKNLKKTVKTGQTRARERKESTKPGDLIARKDKSQLKVNS